MAASPASTGYHKGHHSNVEQPSLPGLPRSVVESLLENLKIQMKIQNNIPCLTATLSYRQRQWRDHKLCLQRKMLMSPTIRVCLNKIQKFSNKIYLLALGPKTLPYTAILGQSGIARYLVGSPSIFLGFRPRFFLLPWPILAFER